VSLTKAVLIIERIGRGHDYRPSPEAPMQYRALGIHRCRRIVAETPGDFVKSDLHVDDQQRRA
jgi:hypothetical protein